MVANELRRAAEAARRRVESIEDRGGHRVVASISWLARTKGTVWNVCGTSCKQRTMERDNLRLHGCNGVVRLGTKGRVALAIT
jgi:hypothetical protein